MAKKGTYGALAAQTGSVDFGEVARTAVGDIEAKRQAILKEELLKSQQETKQKQYTQKLRQQSYKDTVAFAKEAKDMMNINTTGMLNPVLTEVLKTSQAKYADMMREFQTAGTGRRAELNIEMQRYNSIANNVNSMSEGINNFFKDYNSQVNGKPKYSAFGSSRTVLGTIQAIKAAATQGLTKNDDGSYNWGDNITIDNMGTPDMKLRITGTDGEQLANNSMESITSSLSQGLKPYNDFSGLIQKMANDIDVSETTKVEFDGKNMATIKATDVPQTMKTIDAYVNNMIGSDDSDRMNELLNNGKYGDTPKEIRKNMGKSLFDMVKKTNQVKISKDPEAKANQEKENNQTASTTIRNIIQGGEVKNESLRNKIWNDTFMIDDKQVSGAKIKSTQRVGNYFVVTGVSGGKTGTITYDLTRMNQRESVGMNIAQGLQGVPGQTKFDTNAAASGVDYGNIPVIEGKTGSNVAAALDKVVAELAPLKASSSDPSDADMNAAIESITKEAKKLGITFDVDMGTWATDNEITITMPDGTDIEIEAGNHKDAIDQFMNQMSTIFNQPVGQPQTTDVVAEQTISTGGAY